jgi:hypothetical protein
MKPHIKLHAPHEHNTVNLSDESITHRNREADYWRGFLAAARLSKEATPGQLMRLLMHAEQRVNELKQENEK